MSAPAFASPSRPPSAPAVGAARFTVQASLASIVFYYLSQVVPLDIAAPVEFLVSMTVGGAVAAAGKYLRDRGWDVVPF